MQGLWEGTMVEREGRLPEGSAIALEYVPEGWSEEDFRSAGGFVGL